MFTQQRRREVVNRLRHGDTSRLSPHAALTLALGLLTADDAGHVSADVVALAASDPETVAIARELLRKAV